MPKVMANLESLDGHLMEVVRALQGAMKRGMSHKENPQLMETSIHDCKEMLDEIMKGNIKEWLN